MFLGTIGSAEESLADDRQTPIAQLCPDSFVHFPVGLVCRHQHGMNDVRQYFIDPGFAEQVERPAARPGYQREMVIPERVR